MHTHMHRGGGSTARLGGRELRLLCGFNQCTLVQNRDNSGLLGTPMYSSLKLGGRCPPNAQVGGAAAPPAPPCGAPPDAYIPTYTHTYIPTHTCIHTHIHTYIHTYLHTYIHTYLHTHACIHTYIHTHTHV